MANNMLVIIVHGAYGDSSENWFPWLRDSLLENGIKAVAPDFPTPENQSVQSWTQILDAVIAGEHSNTVLVGHSAACPFILRWLENAPESIRATFLLSSFIRDIGISKFDSINEVFFREPYQWDKIIDNAGSAYVIHSDNDPYVPIEHGQEVADGLGVKLTTIHNGGHLNSEAGFNEFPLLLSLVMEVVKKHIDS